MCEVTSTLVKSDQLYYNSELPFLPFPTHPSVEIRDFFLDEPCSRVGATPRVHSWSPPLPELDDVFEIAVPDPLAQ